VYQVIYRERSSASCCQLKMQEDTLTYAIVLYE
jgi:hypothetical protein